jgi:hypothetical protein
MARVPNTGSDGETALSFQAMAGSLHSVFIQSHLRIQKDLCRA